ncbi:E3 ubiquitin-protein ligase RFI2 [Mangifera indica]|uniref:E3 ubiquitin-protein ligase RFI2 n=1 Tax=Mangifera indica TaxID=29780 RepID=UPI001CFBB0EE|nr:E3 ubiquitin-protein ligase RFI2 [Mangifera indica]
MVGSVATTTHRHPPMDATGDGDDDDQAIEAPSLVSCSICLEAVTDDGSRSTAKLHCGHQFHLDCIGSAFNMKGAMQCPNCRKVEKGQWLYANGSTRSLPEFSLEDWIPDEDFYDLSYSEVPFRVHWCPFGELARVGSSFEEVEPPPTTYHDQRGHHPILAEQEAASMAHSYVAYVGPVPTTTSRPSNNVDDTPLNYHWNGPSGHNEIFPPHAFPAIQYHSWGHHSPPFSVSGSHMNGADPASVLPATQRSSHGESDAVTMSRSFPHPFVFDHGSGPRRGGSFVSSVVPRHPGSTAVNLERIQASHSFLPQQQLSNSSGLPTPVGPGLRRFDGLMSLPAVVPPPQHDQNGNFFIFPPSSSGQNLQEAESPFYNRFHVWERERLSRFPAVIRDSSWGLFHQTSGASDSGNRPGSFWHRQSS